jgi:hypothetical protein
MASYSLAAFSGSISNAAVIVAFASYNALRCRGKKRYILHSQEHDKQQTSMRCKSANTKLLLMSASIVVNRANESS